MFTIKNNKNNQLINQPLHWNYFETLSNIFSPLEKNLLTFLPAGQARG
jgi:hypothetical protein